MASSVGDDEYEGETVLLRGQFNTSGVVKYTMLVLFISMISIFPIYILMIPFIHFAVKAYAESMEVFLTETAVVYKYGYYGCCCCCWGHVEKTIPLEKITDVAYIQGCMERCYNIETLNVQTAGSGGPTAELRLVGLDNARAFRSAVLEARRAQANGGSARAAVARVANADDLESGGDASPLLSTLRSIDGSVKNIEKLLSTKV